MKIEAGKFYRTRNGRKAFVVAVAQNPFMGPDPEFPVIGIVDDEEGGYEEFWLPDGSIREGVDDYNDLVSELSEPKRVVGYINIPDPCRESYLSRNLWLYPSRKAADCFERGRIACIRIEVEEGRFDD